MSILDIDDQGLIFQSCPAHFACSTWKKQSNMAKIRQKNELAGLYTNLSLINCNFLGDFNPLQLSPIPYSSSSRGLTYILTHSRVVLLVKRKRTTLSEWQNVRFFSDKRCYAHPQFQSIVFPEKQVDSCHPIGLIVQLSYLSYTRYFLVQRMSEEGT